MPDRPAFSVDEMLGSLAKWLRIMGYDAVYHRDQTDNQIVEFAREEGRFLLTRDRELAVRAKGRGLYIVDDDVMQQLRQVSEEYGLILDESGTRCTLCNGRLEALGQDDVRGKIPEGALMSNSEFYRCVDCGKLYWKGTHWTDIRARLSSLESARGNDEG